MTKLLAGTSILLAVSCTKEIPEEWITKWNNPPQSCRPLKITHLIPNEYSSPAEYFKFLHEECGVGGVVINYPGHNYLSDEQEWKYFVDEMKAAVDEGLRVWLYDEKGYPSLSAGGLVLQKDPSLEAKEMVYDSTLTQGRQFYTRESFEYTHVCNNYCALRRYPDPGNPASMQYFTEITHQAILDHFGKELFAKVEAFFTDEPSYMGVNLGPIPEKVRNSVPVVDKPDYTKKLLPAIAWSPGIDADYQNRFEESLEVSSLFRGDSDKDKQVRERFWTLMGERFKNNYCGIMRLWCQNAGVKASGHFLREELIFCHTPIYGNMLSVERGLDIPGMDMLDTDPSTWNTGSSMGWMISGMPLSAAAIDGKRLVMSEVSDHNQSVLGDGPASLEAMKGTAACHLAGGVTEFHLYYAVDGGEKHPYRNAAAYKNYCEYVGRMNSILRAAQPIKNVVLYYPSLDLQREYIPTAEALNEVELLNEKTQQVTEAFTNAGASLARAQVPCIFADYLILREARTNGGKLIIGDGRYDGIVIPEGTTLEDETSAMIDEFEKSGGKVFRSPRACTYAEIAQAFVEKEHFAPAEEKLVFGKFEREGRTIYVICNGSDTKYEGVLENCPDGQYSILDPETGKITKTRTDKGLKLSIETQKSIILVKN